MQIFRPVRIGVVFMVAMLWGGGLVRAVEAATLTSVEYKNVGGEALLLDVCVPESTIHKGENGLLPVVIIVHGGGWGSGDRKTMMQPILDTLTGGGYIFVSMDYRLSPASRWPACQEDVTDALAWTKAHVSEYGGDPDRMAVLGYSAGGQLAFWAAINDVGPHKLKGLIGVAPATDFLNDLGRRNGPSKALRDLMNCDENDPMEKTLLRLYEASPINYLHENMPPILILQGTEDRTVPPQQSRNIQLKIKDQHWKVPCEIYAVPGAPHRQSEWDKYDPGYKKKLLDWLGGTL